MCRRKQWHFSLIPKHRCNHGKVVRDVVELKPLKLLVKKEIRSYKHRHYRMYSICGPLDFNEGQLDFKVNFLQIMVYINSDHKWEERVWETGLVHGRERARSLFFMLSILGTFPLGKSQRIASMLAGLRKTCPTGHKSSPLSFVPGAELSFVQMITQANSRIIAFICYL